MAKPIDYTPTDSPNYKDPTASLRDINRGNARLRAKTARGYKAVDRAVSRRSGRGLRRR